MSKSVVIAPKSVQDTLVQSVSNLESDISIKNAVGKSLELSTSEGGIRLNKIYGETHKSRNLIPFPYKDTTVKSINGVTATINSDRSISLSGTNSTGGSFNLFYVMTGDSTGEFDPGTYSIGGIVNGSASTCKGMVSILVKGANGTYNTTSQSITITDNNGCEFTSDVTFKVFYSIAIMSNATIDATAYPMLVKNGEGESYPTSYEPYGKIGSVGSLVSGQLSCVITEHNTDNSKSDTIAFPINDKLRSVNNVKDYIDEDGEHHLIGVRSYTSGDESNTAVITDLTNTYYVLTTPVVTPLTTDQLKAIHSLKAYDGKTYIDTTDTFAKVTLDVDYSKVQSGVLKNENEIAVNKYADNARLSNLESNFQDGVNTIIEAVNTKANASLDGSNTPAEIVAAIANIQGGGDDSNFIAPEYNSENTYAEGDYVIYDNTLYKLESETATGEWDASKWSETSLTDIEEKEENYIAPPYDSTNTYNTDDVVYYKGVVYKCIEDNITGEFNIFKWQDITLSDLNSNLGGKCVASFTRINGSALFYVYDEISNTISALNGNYLTIGYDNTNALFTFKMACIITVVKDINGTQYIVYKDKSVSANEQISIPHSNVGLVTVIVN